MNHRIADRISVAIRMRGMSEVEQAESRQSWRVQGGMLWEEEEEGEVGSGAKLDPGLKSTPAFNP